MVADVHRTLLYGGVFGNPGDAEHENGKLRLAYEVAPMAFIMRQAGGKGVDNDGEDLLAKTPRALHERSSCWLGSADDVDELRRYLRKDRKKRQRRERESREDNDDFRVQSL
jgi:fructose-1,6-bisphosphatase I